MPVAHAHGNTAADQVTGAADSIRLEVALGNIAVAGPGPGRGRVTGRGSSHPFSVPQPGEPVLHDSIDPAQRSARAGVERAVRVVEAVVHGNSLVGVVCRASAAERPGDDRRVLGCDSISGPSRGPDFGRSRLTGVANSNLDRKGVF